MKEIIDVETLDHGYCAVDVYRALGDLYETIAYSPIGAEGSYKIPDASYGPEARDRNPCIAIGHLIQKIETSDVNGWSHIEEQWFLDGKMIASRTN